MKPATKRTISLLLSALCIVVAISVYSRFLVPLYAQVGTRRAEYNVKQATLDQQRSIVANVNSILAKYQSIPTLNDIVSLAVPPAEELSGIFDQITAIGQDSGLSVDRINVSATNPVVSAKPAEKGKTQLLKPYGVINITLNLSGTYEELKQFLASLERNVRLMDVTTMRLQPTGQATRDFYIIDLLVKAYYQSM